MADKKPVISVYTLKQAEKVAGEWSKKHASIKNEGRKVTDVYAEAYNKNFSVSGSYYELDEEATDLYKKAVAAKSKKK